MKRAVYVFLFILAASTAAATTGVLSDQFGKILGTADGPSVQWNKARLGLYGPATGYEPPRLSLSQPTSASLAWRTRPITVAGFVQLGARPYEPMRRTFLSFDPLGHEATLDGYAAFGGNPCLYFDPDGRLSKGASSNFEDRLQSLYGGGDVLSEFRQQEFYDQYLAPKLTPEEFFAGVVGLAAGALNLPWTLAQGVAADIVTAWDGTYVNQYGLTQQASTGRRVFAGVMVATTLPIGGIAKVGSAGLRGLTAATEFKTAMQLEFDFVNQFGRVAEAATDASHVVYQGVDKAGAVRYVGITQRGVVTRAAEHVASGEGKENLIYSVIRGAEGLTKQNARIWEQKLINQYGLGKNGGQLLNKINSIDPKYWDTYGIIP